MVTRTTAIALGVAGALLLVALAASWLAGLLPWMSDEAAPDRLPALDAQAVAQGRAIYQANCASCHGPKGEGAPNWKTRNPDDTLPPPPHDVSGHTWHHADGLLYRIVRDGGTIYESPGFKSAMPAWGGRLTDTDIRAVITYVKSLWGPRERKIQAEVSEQDPYSTTSP